MRASNEPRRVADGVLMIRAGLWMIALRGAKFLLPLPRLARLMQVAPRRAPRNPSRERRIAALVDRVAASLRLADQGNCLERSLVLYRLLSRAGAEPRLIVGMTRTAGAVSGHAWVTVDGRPVGERVPDGMTPVAVFGVERS